MCPYRINSKNDKNVHLSLIIVHPSIISFAQRKLYKFYTNVHIFFLSHLFSFVLYTHLATDGNGLWNSLAEVLWSGIDQISALIDRVVCWRCSILEWAFFHSILIVQATFQYRLNSTMFLSFWWYCMGNTTKTETSLVALLRKVSEKKMEKCFSV